jgi:hypothetical protein
MKRSVWVMLAAGFLAGAAFAPAPAAAQVQAGIVLDRDGLRHFHLAIGHYYGYPVQTVDRWHTPWIHADELPVVYLLAREARVSPEVIIALREQGWSWIDITYHLRVDPAIYVGHLGPPYGVAHGYWKKPHRNQYRRLSDRQIIDYVNVGFWAGYQRRPVREIIIIRERIPSWSHYARVEAPRVRVQQGYQAAPPPVQSQPRPAQPRPAQVTGGRGAVSPPSSVDVRGRAPAAAPSRGSAPAASRPPATRAPSAAGARSAPPAASRGSAPSASRGAPPAASRGSAPAASRPPATRAPSPAASRGAPPAASRGSAPAASRPPAARTPPPAASRNSGPAASRSGPPASAGRPPASGGQRPPANRNRGGGGG